MEKKQTIFESSREILEGLDPKTDKFNLASDLLDDLDLKQITALINYLIGTGHFRSLRASIKVWRAAKGLPADK